VAIALGHGAEANAAQEPGAPAQEGSKPAPAPTATSAAEPPIYIFLNAPADLDAFWRRWAQPDFVLQRGIDYERRRFEAARSAVAGTLEGRRASIDTLTARGEVVENLAHLNIELSVTVAGKDTVWVPIRLDDLTVTQAREAERDLPLRNREGGWQIGLAGEGVHTLRVDLLVPVKSTADGRKIELPIPQVASTRVEIDVAQHVVDAVAGGRDLVAIEPIEAGQRSRLSANLSPRSSLEVTWRVAAPVGRQPPALLETHGEIALEIDAAKIRSQATFQVSASRGSVSSLSFTIDPEESVLSAEVDDEPLAVQSRAGELVVPLTEPLRPGATRRVVLVTQRKLPAAAQARWIFRGYPLANAPVQTGIVSISQASNLWIEAEAGRAARLVDVRELPRDFRARPTTVHALQFLDQPFQITLQAEPAPPQARVASRSTVTIDPSSAKLDSWLDYQLTRGGVFELHVRLPRGLELDEAGPESVVQSYHWLPERPGEAVPDLAQAQRILTLRLTSRARDDGNVRVHLLGHQEIDPAGRVELALFQPQGASPAGARLAVLATRNVAVDLAQGESGVLETSDFALAGGSPPGDWPWPAGKAPQTPAALWLRHEGNPALLPLQATIQPKTVHHETTLSASIERRRIDVVQETVCHVHYGALTHVDIAVPPAIEGLWDLDGDEVAARESLRIDADGQHRYRLTLRREVTDNVRLKFRYRLPLEPPIASTRVTQLSIPWLTVLEGRAAGPRLEVLADPGIQVESDASGWVRSQGGQSAGPRDAGEGSGFTLTRAQGSAGAVTLRATARALVSLPSIVASRLWMRTIFGADGLMRTLAWYRLDAYERSFSVVLPPGAQWVRAFAGGNPLTDVEQLPGGTYRLHLPTVASGSGVVVGLEFTTPASTTFPPRLVPPRLPEGSLVQDVYWELAVPWNQVALESPGNWIDENEWFWDQYTLKRRPWKNADALATWLAGPGSHPRLAEDFENAPRGSYHGYLFHCVGAPQALRLPMLSRAGMVGMCSGLALALGVLILLWWPSRLLPALVVGGFLIAVAGAERPNLTLLIVQSSLPGLALVLLAALVQRVTETRRPSGALFGEPPTITTPAVPGSSLKRTGAAGSDDSTAIRIRPGSTQEHIPTQPVPNLGGIAKEPSKLDR
jgi:hypothetical protein